MDPILGTFRGGWLSENTMKTNGFDSKPALRAIHFGSRKCPKLIRFRLQFFYIEFLSFLVDFVSPTRAIHATYLAQPDEPGRGVA